MLTTGIRLRRWKWGMMRIIISHLKKKTGVVHIPTEIAALEEAFEKYHDELNCFIVEPLLQGAGGMRMYDISFLKRARELCDAYDVLLIFDEVATDLEEPETVLWQIWYCRIS